MVIIITGATHTGKTVLAQRLLEKYKYPYFSMDHLKMGLIRSKNISLTPLDDEKLMPYLWGIIKEIIKTAIENQQNLIIEGGYIPFNWAEDFSAEYLKNIDYYARKSFMSRSAYIARAAIYNTTVIDGLKEFTKEINRLGSNINQIVMLANQGIMKTVDFGEFNELIAKVISYLIEIKGGQERAYNRKGGRKEREKR